MRKPIRKIYKGMVDLKTLFEDKKNVFRGFTKDELISIYYKIPIKKVLTINSKTIESKWNEIVTVKKYLLWKDSFPIIFKTMSKGTELNNEEVGIRILTKRTNVFFRCSNILDAGKWRDTFDKMARSFHKTGSKPSEIIEDEIEAIPVLEKIKQTN